VQVSRRLIDGGAAEDLFTFRPSSANTDGNPLAHAASVAPDGTGVAYADDAGVHRYDIASGVTTLLLANPCQTEPRPEKGCTAYINPQWSPDGRWVLASKLLWEGSISVVVGADDPASVREFADVGGDHQSWSPDSRYFCAYNETFVPGGAHFVSPVDGSRSPEHPELARATSVRACVWDDFGKLAIAGDTGGSSDASRVAVFGIQSLSGVDNVVLTLDPPYTSVTGFLPDGSGLIVKGVPPCAVVCGERPPVEAALLLDGSVRSLPFVSGLSAAGDGVVGAIPLVPPKDD
jgi:hypothetical protein